MYFLVFCYCLYEYGYIVVYIAATNMNAFVQWSVFVRSNNFVCSNKQKKYVSKARI